MNRRNGGAYDNDNDTQSKKGADTIDILEDCLEQIYEARKAHLMAKQVKNTQTYMIVYIHTYIHTLMHT